MRPSTTPLRTSLDKQVRNAIAPARLSRPLGGISGAQQRTAIRRMKPTRAALDGSSRQSGWCRIFDAAPGTQNPVAGATYSELATREAEHARTELARAENARTFALRQSDAGLREHFLRLASRRELDSSYHAQRARRFEALAAEETPHSDAVASRRRAPNFSLGLDSGIDDRRALGGRGFPKGESPVSRTFPEVSDGTRTRDRLDHNQEL
jgi:hypothetical protein